MASTCWRKSDARLPRAFHKPSRVVNKAAHSLRANFFNDIKIYELDTFHQF